MSQDNLTDEESTYFIRNYPLTHPFIMAHYKKQRTIPVLAAPLSSFAVSCATISYFAFSLTFPEKRLVMDYVHDEYSNNGSGKPRYSGGIVDVVRKIYAEEGIAGVLGKKEAVAALIEMGATIGYFATIGNAVKSFTVPNSWLEFAIDTFLMNTVIHPILVVSFALHKRFDDKTKDNRGFIETSKKIYSESGVKGFYRGFGWSFLFHLEKVYKNGLAWVIRSGVEFFLDIEHENLDAETHFTLKHIEINLVKILYDVIMPFSSSLGRYVGDQGATYSNYFDCVKKTYQQEGLKGLYKGSWVAIFL